jgi:hypothetical protein
VIGWRLSKTTYLTLGAIVAVCHFSSGNWGHLEGNNPIIRTVDTDDNAEIKKKTE